MDAEKGLTDISEVIKGLGEISLAPELSTGQALLIGKAIVAIERAFTGGYEMGRKDELNGEFVEYFDGQEIKFNEFLKGDNDAR